MSQITIGELSKTELKKILTEKEVAFNASANHQDLIDLVTKTLGTDTIDDGLSDPANGAPGTDATDEDKKDGSEGTDVDVKAPAEVVETAAQKKAREKAEKKASQVKRVPWEYIVLANLKRDGEFYPKGSTILIEDEEAAEKLLAEGTVE